MESSIPAIMVLLCLLQAVQAVKVLNVNNGSQLVDVLCNGGVFGSDDEVILALDSSVHYDLSVSAIANNSCLVPPTRSLTITSATTDIVSITCKPHSPSLYPVPTIGFLFTDTNVTISHLLFTGCGSPLTQYNDSINVTQPYFKHDQSGFLVFYKCSVNMTRVTITKYYGFGIIVKDPQQLVLFDELTINQSMITRGNGVLMLINNDIYLLVSNSRFHGNYVTRPTGDKKCEHETTFIQYQSLLTILFINNILQPNIHITNTNFTGSFPGGIILSMSNSRGAGHVTITRVVFTNTMVTTCTGSALTIYGINVNSQLFIEVHESYFNMGHGNNTTGVSEYGPVLISMDNEATFIHFKKVTFNGNLPAINGACMTVSVYSRTNTMVILESVQVYNNTQEIQGLFIHSAGLFVLDNVRQVIINGTKTNPSWFHQNKGSVIQTKNSLVKIQGYVSFVNNKGISGAVINAKDTIVTMDTNLSLTMINNSAIEMGGAIYIMNSFHKSLPKCALQFGLTGEVNITSVNNTALLAGNTVYVYPLYNCYSEVQHTVINSMTYYMKSLGIKPHYSPTNTRLSISTLPNTLEFCDKSDIETYYGQTGDVCVRASDINNNTVYSTLSVSIPQQTLAYHGISNLLIEQSETLKKTNENINGDGTNVQVSIHLAQTNHSNSSSREFQLDVIFSSTSVKQFIVKRVRLLDCPPGFQLTGTTCQCSSTTRQYFQDLRYEGSCKVSTLTITKPIEIYPWMGMGTNNQFTIAKNCPKEHCAYQTKQTIFKYNYSNYVLATSESSVVKSMCLPNRKGTACGQCEEGFSVVFGSDECKQCSNHWLWTLVIYILIGPLLIYILYALRLTLNNGTINGVIFFAQVCYAGLMQSIITRDDDSKYIRLIFIASLNLKLGFPLCFYNGMDEIWKGAISLLFPVYLLALLGVIVIISRFSTWFSKKVSPYSIQVLVTVVHLSVATLLTAIIDVSIPITVWTDNGTHQVWRRNGSVTYMSTYHAVLFTITMIVVSSILVPYLTLLLFGKWFCKKSPSCSIYIRPILEAVLAPYKEKYQYWFTVRLMFIIMLYSLYAFNTSTSNKSASLYVAIFLTILLLAQAAFWPLKSKLLNAVELLLSFGAAVSFFAHFIASRQVNHQIISVPFSIIVYIVILIFICIVVYHVAMVTGYLQKLKLVATKVKQKIKQNISIKQSKKDEENSYDSENLQSMMGSFYDNCNDYREPFLAPTTQTINL